MNIKKLNKGVNKKWIYVNIKKMYNKTCISITKWWLSCPTSPKF